MYTQSVRVVQTTITQRDLEEQLHSLREEHTREIQHLQESQARDQNRQEEIQLRAREGIIAAKEREIQDLLRSHDKAIEAKEKENQQLRRELEQVMRKKEPTKETLEGQLKQMQLRADPDLTCKPQTKGGSMKYADVTDIELMWETGETGPRMYRVSNAVTDKGMVYFNANGDNDIYSYNIDSVVWTQLPDCPNKCSSFAVINNKLTAIGGVTGSRRSTSVHSLKDGKEWIEEFPPMPTKRASATSVYTDSEASLIVVGGMLASVYIRCPVEILNIVSCQWFVASDIPVKDQLVYASGVICRGQLYILGGMDTMSVYSCSLSNLFQSCVSASKFKASSKSSNIWRELANLPVYDSTCVSVCGHILAIGGCTSGDYFSPGIKCVYA